MCDTDTFSIYTELFSLNKAWVEHWPLDIFWAKFQTDYIQCKILMPVNGLDH